MLFISLIIGIKSINEKSTNPLETGKEYLAQGQLAKAKQYASENNDKSLLKQVHQANSIYQLATSNKTSLEYSMTKYLELISICSKSKKFHMEALNISLRLNNDTLFDTIYRKLKIIDPEENELLAMKGFKNLKNTNFANAKVFFNQYKKRSSKYSQIDKDINMLEKSLKGSLYFIKKNQTVKSLKYLKNCQKIMQKYSISDNSILSKEIAKIDIDIYILTQKYEEAVKRINDLISKIKDDEFLYIKRGNILYIHKDYSGCISDFEAALSISKNEKIKKQVHIYLNKAKKFQENERKINYYSVLNLKPGADINEVKKSYRRLVIFWHPDRFKEILKKKEAEKRMKLINRAYDIIGNEESKHVYDFCHHLTDVPPYSEDKRGFFSKLLNMNKENVWNKCYEDDYQFNEKFDESKEEKFTFSNDLFMSSYDEFDVSSFDEFDESDENNSEKSFELFNVNDSTNETSSNSSDSKINLDSMLNFMTASIVFEITKSIISFMK